MYGNTVGELRVIIELEGGMTYTIFQETGDKGIGWKSAVRDIDYNVKYRVGEACVFC